MSHAWTEETLETYASGLLSWHVYCDAKNILEMQRITSFLASMAGLFSNKTLHNYVHGICAWHILHGSPWAMNDDELKTILKATEKLTPATSRRKKRRPYTPEFITAIKHQLNLDSSLDAAVFACLTTCFYAVGRLGEFTVRRLDSFNATLHASPAHTVEMGAR